MRCLFPRNSSHIACQLLSLSIWINKLKALKIQLGPGDFFYPLGPMDHEIWIICNCISMEDPSKICLTPLKFHMVRALDLQQKCQKKIPETTNVNKTVWKCLPQLATILLKGNMVSYLGHQDTEYRPSHDKNNTLKSPVAMAAWNLCQ